MENDHRTVEETLPDNKFRLINEICTSSMSSACYQSLITDLSPGVLYQCGVLMSIKADQMIYNK